MNLQSLVWLLILAGEFMVVEIWLIEWWMKKKKAPESSGASWPLRLYLAGILGWVMPELLTIS